MTTSSRRSRGAAALGAGLCVRLRALSLLALLGSAAARGADGVAAGNNAITAADDAFGTSVGSQAIGLYTQIDARGFNPQQAGNLRIEGLYFDQQTWITSPCLSNQSAMRVGLSAQAFSFPAPSGIADLKLNTPGDSAAASLIAHLGAFGQADVLVMNQSPLGKGLSVGVCAGFFHTFSPDLNVRDDTLTAGTTLRFRPTDGVEIAPFWTRVNGGGRGIRPLVYTDGVAPLPMFSARRLAVLPFATAGWPQTTLGATLHAELGRQWRLAAGLFRSKEDDPQGFVDEYLSLAPDRSVDHWLDVVPAFVAASTSGEVRLERLGGGTVHSHKLVFTLRGRDVDRDFGGDALVHYPGPVTLESPPASQAVYSTTRPSRDRVRQLDAGIGLEEHWQGIGSVGLGILRSHYQRSVVDTLEATSPTSASPWLGNARFVLEAGAHLSLYGSYVQGLEDSALAPSSDANRGEPLPAMRTRQGDVGIRYAPDEHLSLMVGAFDIDKAYVNSDAANVYRVLGTLRHRGVETSLTYNHGGLTLVAGGVHLRPQVARSVSEPGATGDLPIGPVPLVLLANLDYAPARWKPWAVSMQWTRQSARVQTADDRYQLPAFSTVGLGIRYESTIGSHPWSVRLDGINLANTQALHLSPVGLVTPELSRRVLLTFAVDR